MIPVRRIRRAAAITLAVSLTACGGDGTGGPTPPAASNRAPMLAIDAPATATELQTVTLGVTATDPDGDALSIAWTQKSGVAVTLTGADAAVASFTAPISEHAIPLLFNVSVADGHNAPVSEDVVVTIQPGLRGAVFVTDTTDGDDHIHRKLLGETQSTVLATVKLHDGALAHSPDGRRLAFLGEREDRVELVVLDVADGSSGVIASGDLLSLTPLAFSPDGRRLAFQAVETFDGSDKPAVYVADIPVALDAFDESSVRLVSGEFPASEPRIDGVVWAPDATRLALTGELCDGSDPISVVVVPVDDAQPPSGACGSETGLRHAGPQGFFSVPLLPAFSPDGKWLAFAAELENARPLIVVVPAEIATLTDRTIDYPSMARYPYADETHAHHISDFAWSPDGTQIAYAVIPSDPMQSFGCVDCGVYTVGVHDDALSDPETDFGVLREKRSGDLLMLEKDSFALLSDDAVVSSLSWAPQGGQLAFTAGASDFDTGSKTENSALALYVVDTDDSESAPRQISGSNRHHGDIDNNGLLDDGGVAGFAWSPDGIYISVLAALDDATHRRGYVTEIWQIDVPAALASADVDNARRQLSGAIEARSPEGIPEGKAQGFAWSADAGRVAFYGDLVTDGQSELYTSPARMAAGERIVLSQPEQTGASLAYGYWLDPLGATSNIVFAPTEN